MKKLVIIYSIIIVAMFMGLLTLSQKVTFAQSATFHYVQPFSTPGGLFGFFDQKDGKLYLYDSNLEKCIYTFQLEELGKPLSKM